jgi:ATP-binding cassette, subfamily B, bacterial
MKSYNRDTLRIYWEHARKYKGQLFLIVLGMIGGSAADSYIPFLYRKLFNSLVENQAGLNEVYGIVWMIFGTGAVMWFFFRIDTFILDRFQPRVMLDLVNTCFKYLHDHSFNFFNNNFGGSLVRRVGRFERGFEDIFDHLYWHFSSAALKLVLAIVLLYYFVHPALALVMLIWSLVYIAFSYGYAKFKLPYDLEAAAVDSTMTGRVADTITNNMNLKLFGGTFKEFKSFKKLTDKVFKIRFWTWRLSSISDAIQAAFMFILEAVMLFVAVKFWRTGALTVGDFALIQGFMFQIFGRLWDLGRNIKAIYQRLADAEEMTEILMTPHEVQNVKDAKELRVKKGEIEFQGVSFSYEGKQKVFSKFDLKIRPGERVALIGPSGGGKSTIVKLLLRFFDIQSGQIIIDNQDIAKVQQVSLRQSIALVPQEPILFHRSLYNNIAYSRPSATRAEVVQAAKMAHCHEFISKFPEGYDTFVGERGVKLSGGERQRVAIARAIVSNAPILVLDEATSSLDSESEMFIQDSLKNLMAGKTTIVIAHRLSTIMQMDRIVVIENGKVTEEGKHEELVKAKQGTYQKLWEIQAGGFTE